MIRVKICGITGMADALMCADLGADMLGLNFYKNSPRYITPDFAREIVSELRRNSGERCPLFVGIFVNAPVKEILSIHEHVGLDYDQLSGGEGVEEVAALRGKAFRAIRPESRDDALPLVAQLRSHFIADDSAPSVLVDAYHPRLYGGTGEVASPELALAVKELVPRMMLAGGLNPENVKERAQLIQPWGVDVASGVEEAPGKKSAMKTKMFIERVRSIIEPSQSITEQ